MDPKNSFAFRKLLPIYNCIFLFTYLAAQTVSQDPKFHSCEPKNCGAGPNISYPFWLSQEQESFCGYPNFMLNCSDKRPVLAISNDVCIIEDIFYANNSMRVVNAAVYEETCPTPLHNISLDRTTPFTISPGYIDFSFFYNCTSKPKDYNNLYNLSCATNSTHYSFAGFHLEEIEIRSIYSLNSCQDFANTPIHTGEEDIGSLLRANYTDVLKMGFLMNWTARNCSSCERSGGRCGYENTAFICFCSDRPRLESCDAGTSSNAVRKILIGLGAALGTLVTMLIAVFWYRRKKRQYESIFSRSIKSVPIFLKKKHNQDLEVFIRNHGPLALKRYNLHLELDDGFELNGVTNAEQSDIVRQIAIVGLWCILTYPSDRPSMRKVIEMLEGPLGALKIPPKPRLYSPPRLLSYSSTTSLV
ncbi:hypothetical protein D5086_028071 [Populus alba]|uniref:Uncharacterized protein n=1 Tax=Populus alba TaxID=43335 RepID=A0ACC4AX43_POPAL